MIRDELIPAARWRVPPDSDELAAQRVSNLCGHTPYGLTFTVYASVKQLTKALSDGAGYMIDGEKRVANGPDSKIWRVRIIDTNSKSKWFLWLWETTGETTVLTVEVEDPGDLKDRLKEIDEA
jgi:hypothetical protein